MKSSSAGVRCGDIVKCRDARTWRKEAGKDVSSWPLCSVYTLFGMSLMMACLTTAGYTKNTWHLQGTCIFSSDAYASVAKVESLSAPSENNVPSAFPGSLPDHGRPDPPLAMLVSVAYLAQTGMERFFRNGKPVPTSAPLATNFALVGGAGDQCVVGGWGRFSFGTDSKVMVAHCCLAKMSENVGQL